MIGSINDYLRPPQFGALLGLQPRRTAYVLGQLEALGFDLHNDLRGARLVHPDLAAAVKVARTESRDLATLRADPDLQRFLSAKVRNQDLEPLDLLVATYAELAVVRVAVSALSSGLQGIGNGEWRRSGWRSIGLPNPRGEL